MTAAHVQAFSSGDGTAGPGRRERNKLEKCQRIREATRELFSAQGFEATTVRQIAERAEVGLGTLFNYARDKRDLTFLLFNDDLSRLADDAIAGSARKVGLLEQVMAVWEPHYRYFARDPVLCRILLRDMYFYEEGPEARRFHATEARLRRHLLMLVATAQRARQVTRTASAGDIALLLFSVFEGSVRYWMHQATPVAEEGLAVLRRLVRTQLRSFLADDGRAATDADTLARNGRAGSPRARRADKGAPALGKKK